MPAIKDLLTIGDVANKLGVEIHQIRYVLRKHGIQGARKLGNYWVYGPEQVRQIKSGLNSIKAA